MVKKNWVNFIPTIQIIIDQINDGIFLVNADGTILLLNQYASKLTGYTKEELIGKPVGSFMLGHPNPELARSMAQDMKHSKRIYGGAPEKNTSVMTEITSKNGQKTPIEISHLHLTHSKDNISLIIARNMTERQIAEKLQETSFSLSSSLNLEEVFDLLLVELHKLIPYDSANVMVINGTTLRTARSLSYDSHGKVMNEISNQYLLEINEYGDLKDAIFQRQPIIIKDTLEIPNWPPDQFPIRLRSWLGYPIVIDNHVDAVISLDKVEPDFFTEEHAAILTIFSTQAASAIKNARLYKEEGKRIQQLAGLQATLASINSQLELKTLLKEIVARAIDLLGAINGELAMYDPEMNKLNILVWQNFREDYSAQVRQFNQDLLDTVASTKKPIKIDHFSEISDAFDDMKFLGEHSAMAVPLLAGDTLLGVLGIADLKTNRVFNDADIELLNTFAQQATIAIRNSQLYEDAKQRAEEAETMRRVGAVVTSSLNQGQAINSILEQLALVIPYDSAAVLLQKRENLSVVGSRGLSALYRIQGKKIPLTSTNPITDVYLQKRPINISNMSVAFPEFAQELGLDSEIKSWLGAPLIIKERCLGILALNSTEVDRFSQEHLRLIVAFADQVAIALENAQLYTDAARAADRFMALYQLSQIISTNLKPEDIYPSIHQAVSELMITEFFCISLYDSAAQTISDVYMIDNGEPQVLTTRPLEKGLFSTVLKTGKSLLYQSLDPSTAEELGAVMLGNMSSANISQSILIVPLKIGAKCIGIISTQSYKPGMYTRSDKETLELLAANVAIAIENARLFDEVQKLAITDPLTQMYNRRKFDEFALKEFDRSRRYNRRLCAIMIDLDQFKHVNDTYGHHAGDLALASLAALCKKNVRNIDVLARYGGEEFIILLPETTAAEAMTTAERLRKDCEETKVESALGAISLTISLGVAELNKSCKTLEELVDRADQALYQSKDTGRNKSTLWKANLSKKCIHTNL